MRHAQHARVRLREFALLGGEEIQPLDDARADVETRDPLRDDPCDAGRREFTGGRKLPVVHRQLPLALVIVLADDAWAHIFAPVVELFLQLVLDELPFLLDDENFIQPFREVPHALGIERPRHRDLVQANADLGGCRGVDAELIQRLAHIEIGFAGGDDAEPRARAVHHDAAEPVRAHIGHRRVNFVALEPQLLRQRLVGPADVEPVGRHFEIRGQTRHHAMQIQLDARRGLHRIGDRLHRDPAAGEARHRPAVQAEIEELLRRRWIQHGDHRGRENVVALVRQRGRLRAMVVAHDHQHAAMLRGARGIAVLEHIDGAISARPLAVPHRKDAVVFRALEQIDLLAAPDGGGCKLLIHAGLEVHVVRAQQLLLPPQRLVERAEGRPPIAGNEARRVQPGLEVALALQHGKLHQRLDAGEVSPLRMQQSRSAGGNLGNGIIHWHAPRADVPVIEAAPIGCRGPDRHISLCPARGWCSRTGKQEASPGSSASA